MNLQGQVAILTGATGATGQVLAARLGQLGARLALLSSDAGKLAALSARLALPAEQVLTFAGDLRQPAAAAQAAQAIQARWGRAALLAHLVGGWSGGQTLLEAAPQETAALLDQHLWSTLHSLRAFLPLLQANGWGRVVLVSSPFAQQPAAKGGPYAIAKAAQEALLLTLAQELAGSPITANILQVRSIDPAPSQPAAAQRASTTPAEIVAAIEYLCSEPGSRLNGARLPLYGS
jgi:NAD(P)-dependent dehydrogenase (short-subunit alcohol dehydrogenase family)